MSIEYSISIGIGYEFDEEDIEKIAVKVSAKTHLEDRYDYKTGRKLKSVEVIDEDEYFTLKIGKAEFHDDECDLVDFIADNINCVAYRCIDYVGSGGQNSVIFGPSMKSNTLYIDNITLEGDFLYTDLTSKKVMKELDRIGVELTKLGLKLPKPVVKLVYAIC